MRAKPVFLDSHRFASQLEARVYRFLMVYLGSRNLIDLLDFQVPLTIKPQTKQFNRILWKVDFSIKLKTPLYIEAKGLITRECSRNIKFLEFFDYQAFHRLIFVFQEESAAIAAERIYSIPCFSLNKPEKLKAYLDTIQRTDSLQGDQKWDIVPTTKKQVS